MSEKSAISAKVLFNSPGDLFDHYESLCDISETYEKFEEYLHRLLTRSYDDRCHNLRRS